MRLSPEKKAEKLFKNIDNDLSNLKLMFDRVNGITVTEKPKFKTIVTLKNKKKVTK